MCAYLGEGARRELEFLLKQGAQHLVLPFQVKHSLFQLDALLPQVLCPSERQEAEEARMVERGRGKRAQNFSSRGKHGSRLAAPASSRDGKFSKFTSLVGSLRRAS